jgi:hypothetical protein
MLSLHGVFQKPSQLYIDRRDVMYQPLQQQVVGLYHMMERNPFSAGFMLEGLQPRYKRIMFPFVGFIAGIAMLPLDSLLIAEVMDDIPIQEIEQDFQLFNPLASLAGSQKLVKVPQQLFVLAVDLLHSDGKRISPLNSHVNSLPGLFL